MLLGTLGEEIRRERRWDSCGIACRPLQHDVGVADRDENEGLSVRNSEGCRRWRWVDGDGAGYRAVADGELTAGADVRDDRHLVRRVRALLSVVQAAIDSSRLSRARDILSRRRFPESDLLEGADEVARAVEAGARPDEVRVIRKLPGRLAPLSRRSR